MDNTCRCKRATADAHPCHGKGYTCDKQAVQRFYGPRISALSGAMMKFTVMDTWACDDCWAWFTTTYPVQPMVK